MDGNYLTTGIIALVVLALLISGCAKQDAQIDEPIQDETEPIDNETKPVYKQPPQIRSETPIINDSNATTEGISAVTNASNRFAFDFYSNLKNKEKGNIFFSPYSISTALAMTYEGARGQTAEEIQSVFHFPEDSNVRRPNFASIYNKFNKKDAKYELNTANALWIQQDYHLLEDFTNTIESYYDGKATNVDFVGATEQARQTINGWIEDKTKNKIKNPFPEGSLTPSSRFVLTNAIYFKGTWVKQFDKQNTGDEDFRVGSDQTVKIPMMGRTGRGATFNYAETENSQILEMLYEGEELSMLVLLPKNDDIAPLETLLTLEKLNDWKSQLREQRVNVFIPKFTFDAKYFLNENLKEMGMPSAFSGAADFSGIDGTKNLFIETVVHQAFVDVNEEGTEAAAATGVGGGVTSAPPPVPVFLADHPFIFIIQERETGNILFLGRVINPK